MDMVEKVAQGLYAALYNESAGFGYLDDLSKDLTTVVIDGHYNLKALARAAIEAMREPTPEMEKGLQAYLDHLTAYDEPSCNTAYHCMISAALKEQEKVG